MLSADGRAKLFEYNEAVSVAHYLETAILAEHAFLDRMRIVMQAVGKEYNTETLYALPGHLGWLAQRGHTLKVNEEPKKWIKLYEIRFLKS